MALAASATSEERLAKILKKWEEHQKELPDQEFQHCRYCGTRMDFPKIYLTSRDEAENNARRKGKGFGDALRAAARRRHIAFTLA